MIAFRLEGTPAVLYEMLLYEMANLCKDQYFEIALITNFILVFFHSQVF